MIPTGVYIKLSGVLTCPWVFLQTLCEGPGYNQVTWARKINFRLVCLTITVDTSWRLPRKSAHTQKDKGLLVVSIVEHKRSPRAPR